MKNIWCAVVFGLWATGIGLGADQTKVNPVVAGYADSMVVVKGEKLVAFKADRFLEAPYIVVYFGADWCPDCRRFSPSLVEAYNQQAANERRFEVLLVSRDRSEEEMLKFMKTEKMTWPALAYGKIAGAQKVQELYSGQGIPCLTVLDRQGKVVLQSKSDQDGEEVLREVKRLVKEGR
jgi:nucleoredoxin